MKLLVFVLGSLALASAMMGPPPMIGLGGPPPGAGIPPFVAQMIAMKGKPFGGFGVPPPAAAFVPPPTAAYVQSLLQAKAAAGLPFVPTTIPMGPPPFVAQMIAAKNAAEQAALLQQAQATQPDAMQSPQPPTNSTSTSQPLPTTPQSAQDWLQSLIQSSIAKKLASKSPAGVSPSGVAPPPPNSFGQPSAVERRDAAADSVPQQPTMMPQYPPMMMPPPGYPPFGVPPMPYPMMPFYPPIPYWKMG